MMQTARTGLLRCAQSNTCLILTALLVTLACFLWSERVQVKDGRGWDGVRYASWAQDFSGTVLAEGVNPYYTQRFLPSAVVHYSLRLLRITPTVRHVVRAFGAFDVLLLTIVAGLWCVIARELKLSPVGKWLGLVAYLFNYLALKHTFYCPVTTDAAGYTLGTAMVAAYLRHSRWTLAGLTLTGAFVWPLTVPVGALLLLFPRQETAGLSHKPAPYYLNHVAAGLVTLVWGGITVYVLRTPPTIASVAIEPQYVTPLRSVLSLSIAVVLLYLLVGLCYLLDCGHLFDLPRLLTGRRVVAGLLILAGILATRRLQMHWSNGEPPLFNLKQLVRLTAYSSVARPGMFLVTLTAYYGPVFLLAVLLWKPVCRALHQHGIGLTLAVLLGLGLSINTIARYILNIFVLLIPFVVKVVDELSWSRRQCVFFAAMSLLFSKVWMTMNCGPFTGKLNELPDQYLFMSHGPWVSDSMYLAQGAAVIVGTFALARVCLPQPNQQHPQLPREVGQRAA